MIAVRVQGSAALRIDEIYRYSRDRWGRTQADRPVPAEFGVDGCFFRYEKHFVYWKWLSNGDFVTVPLRSDDSWDYDTIPRRGFPGFV